MRFQVKKRVVAALLGFMLLWPPLHFALQARYDFDAWLFFGWAMYTGPKPLVKVTLVDVQRDRALPLFGELKSARESYTHRRGQYGRLAPPGKLADLALRHHPELDRVGVRIAVGRIDHASSRLGVAIETVVYERRGDATRQVH